VKTYSLIEAAEQLCGDSMKHPELWLRRRIREGRINASRFGREIRMTEQQIEDAFAAFDISGNHQLRAGETRRLGVTAASLRRRSA
jgi:hypothetical protein